jgi:hypothetical protein
MELTIQIRLQYQGVVTRANENAPRTNNGDALATACGKVLLYARSATTLFASAPAMITLIRRAHASSAARFSVLYEYRL